MSVDSITPNPVPGLEELSLNKQSQQSNYATHQHGDSQQHPLHQFDMTVMKHFYECLVGKLDELNPKWRSYEWTKPRQPHHDNKHHADENTHVFSEKQRVIDTFVRFVRESGEPMYVLPGFDYGSVLTFERFLQCLKQDGMGAARRYRNFYLGNKDTRKHEIDLVVFHAKYGILIFETKEWCLEHLDTKRRGRARMHLTTARSCFESLARLVTEATGQEQHIPIYEFVALPNMQERPLNAHEVQKQKQQQQPTTTTTTPTTNDLNESSESSTSSTKEERANAKLRHRVVSYLCKNDLDMTNGSFAKWWQQYVVEQHETHMQHLEAAKKPTKFEAHSLNMIQAIVECSRHNSIMPVVYAEQDVDIVNNGSGENGNNTSATESEGAQPTPVLKLYAELMCKEHEEARAASRAVVVAGEHERLRRTLCLQLLWLLLNEPHKKISVMCAEQNKPYYEAFLAQQRKLYTSGNLAHNVRFYTDLNACVATGTHTTTGKSNKRNAESNEMWIFDAQVPGTNTHLKDVLERLRENATSFWIFTTNGEYEKHHAELEPTATLQVKRVVRLEHGAEQAKHKELKPWLQGPCHRQFRMPLRLACDLLVIGDLITPLDLKQLTRHMRNLQAVPNTSQLYNGNHPQQQQNNQQQQRMLQLHFNATKRFKSIKFVRGGTIENVRQALQMHDSIKAPVVLLHVGDEDLFKSRRVGTSTETVVQSVAERIRDLAQLVKEYSPESFVVVSTLLRRYSKSENVVVNDVNKTLVQLCKQTRDSLNVHYMLNGNVQQAHDGGRSLSGKSMQSYVENFLFVIDYFHVKKNKQV